MHWGRLTPAWFQPGPCWGKKFLNQHLWISVLHLSNWATVYTEFCRDEKKIAGINPLVNRETSFGGTGFPTWTACWNCAMLRWWVSRERRFQKEMVGSVPLWMVCRRSSEETQRRQEEL